MTNKPKAIGTACETAVARYAQAHGFPHAERIALHGALDEGDVQLCPGVVVEVKGGKRAETASDALVAAWLAETEVERRNRGADVAILVLKRKGKGAPNAGSWWAILPGWAFALLVPLGYPGVACYADDYAYALAPLPAVRMTLADAVDLLRRAGYGDPIEQDTRP